MTHTLTPADLELVPHFAATFGRRFAIDVTDFESCGHEALFAASRSFNGTGSFREYAKMRLRGAMSDEVRSRSPVGRKTFRKLREAGHDPCWTDLDGTWADPGEGPELAVARVELELLVREAVAKLPRDMAHLVERVYFADESLAEAGDHIGCSRSWACRRHGEALRRLRGCLAAAA